MVERVVPNALNVGPRLGRARLAGLVGSIVVRAGHVKQLRKLLSVLVATSFVAGTGAATFQVGDDASLRAALDPASGAQNGDTIQFSQDIVLLGDLPAVQRSVVIDGQSHQLSGGNAYRGFLVAGFQSAAVAFAPLNVTLQNLGVVETHAQGGKGLGGGGGGAGLGGAIFIGANAVVTLRNVQVSASVAIGGTADFTNLDLGGGGGGAWVGMVAVWRIPMTIASILTVEEVALVSGQTEAVRRAGIFPPREARALLYWPLEAERVCRLANP